MIEARREGLERFLQIVAGHPLLQVSLHFSSCSSPPFYADINCSLSSFRPRLYPSQRIALIPLPLPLPLSWLLLLSPKSFAETIVHCSLLKRPDPKFFAPSSRIPAGTATTTPRRLPLPLLRHAPSLPPSLAFRLLYSRVSRFGFLWNRRRTDPILLQILSPKLLARSPLLPFVRSINRPLPPTLFKVHHTPPSVPPFTCFRDCYATLPFASSFGTRGAPTGKVGILWRFSLA